jgi:HEAT repeat protein
VDSQERDRRRQDRLTAFREEAAPVKEALAAAGIDPTDFGRFVNRPFPGVLEPAHFDQERAVPVLLDWLPQVRSEYVKESMVRHLRAKAATGIAVEPLVEQFKRSENPSYKWVVADVLQYICGKNHFHTLTELAGDSRHGEGRAPLVDMMWRVKTEQADRVIMAALGDPAVPFQAMSALRRRFGNAAARPHIEPLLSSKHERVRNSAREHLKRIDKYSATHDN